MIAALCLMGMGAMAQGKKAKEAPVPMYEVKSGIVTMEMEMMGRKIVQEIYQLYADGKSATQIIEYCNERGYRTRRGQPFNKNSLRTLLHNEKYIGIYRFGDVVVEGGIPAIIDKAFSFCHICTSLLQHQIQVQIRIEIVILIS